MPQHGTTMECTTTETAKLRENVGPRSLSFIPQRARQGTELHVSECRGVHSRSPHNAQHFTTTVEPLYSGHHWGMTLWPLQRGGLNSGFFYKAHKNHFRAHYKCTSQNCTHIHIAKQYLTYWFASHQQLSAMSALELLGSQHQRCC